MPPRSPAVAREREHRERLEVGRVELERQPSGEVERRDRRRRPLRVGERERDRHAHVRDSRGARARRRRGSGRARGRPTSGGRRPRSARTGGRTGSAPRSARGPCSRAWRESIVIFGPMLQVGCASASSGVTSSSSSRVRPRNGPPDAVRTSECDLSGARPSRHWNAAECSLSTGSSRPPPRSRAASASSPAATRLSLFASARSTPRSSAQSVRGRPAKPTTALRTTSGSARSSSSVRSPPVCVSGASPSIGVRAGGGGDELQLGMRVDDLDRLAADRAGGADQGDAFHRDSMTSCIRSTVLRFAAQPCVDLELRSALGARRR